jgi:hypothetical protein
LEAWVQTKQYSREKTTHLLEEGEGPAALPAGGSPRRREESDRPGPRSSASCHACHVDEQVKETSYRLYANRHLHSKASTEVR